MDVTSGWSRSGFLGSERVLIVVSVGVSAEVFD